MTQTIVKICKCGKAYTRDQWANLPLVGTMESKEEIDQVMHYFETEYRNCPCKSTLAIETEIKK